MKKKAAQEKPVNGNLDRSSVSPLGGESVNFRMWPSGDTDFLLELPSGEEALLPAGVKFVEIQQRMARDYYAEVRSGPKYRSGIGSSPKLAVDAAVAKLAA